MSIRRLGHWLDSWIMMGCPLLSTASATKLRASRVVFDHYNYQKVSDRDTVSRTPQLVGVRESEHINVLLISFACLGRVCVCRAMWQRVHTRARRYTSTSRTR